MDNKISFKGYDARPLCGIYSRDTGLGKQFYSLMQETAQILNKENIDVFIQTKNGIIKNSFQNDKLQSCNINPFAQDRVTFIDLKNFMAKGFLSLNENFEAISEFFKANWLKKDIHVEGGNYFFIKEGHNKEAVLIGKDTLKFHKISEIREHFKGKKLYTITQPDYHIDLSVRPLSNKNIIINDPRLILNELRQAIKKASTIYDKNPSNELGNVIKNLGKILNDTNTAFERYNIKAQTKTLREELKANKFNVIRVPAAILQPANSTSKSYNPNSIESRLFDERKFNLNYLNAIVHERPDKSLVYITNKSDLDKKVGITPEIAELIDFSFEKMFVKNLKGIIKPEDIHFVGGDCNFIQNMLRDTHAGIHCLTSEIPR